MATLTAAQVYALARGAGLPPGQAVVATAVAQAESGLRTDAIGDVALENATWGPSVGLWQIRSLKADYGTGKTRDASQLTDPKFNAQSMASISGGGKNFGAWSTYNNGAFKKFFFPDAAVAQAAGDNPKDTGGGVIAGIGQLLTGDPSGAAAQAAGVGGLGGLTSSWGNDAMKIGLYVLGVGAAAALVITGAVHTVSSK